MNCGLPWLPWAVRIHKEMPFVERLCHFATVPLLMLNSTFPSKTACFLFLFLLQVPPEVGLGVAAFCARHAGVGMRGCTGATRASQAWSPRASTASARCWAGLPPSHPPRHRPAGSALRTSCKTDTAPGSAEGLPQAPKFMHLPWAQSYAGYFQFASKHKPIFLCCN